MKRHAIIVLCLMAMITTCVTTTAEASYNSELRKATKSGRIYDLRNGNAKIIYKATLFTGDFRQAFAEKDAKIHYLTSSETDALIASGQERQGRMWEMYVAMYTRKDYKEFSLGPNSFWEAFLTTAHGERVLPTVIEKVPISPYWKIMFPYLGRWDKMYRVEFPKAALGDAVDFTMQSVEGQKTVSWKLK